VTAWQALVLSLPTRNSTIRMRVWRALKDAGCGVLRDGVYVLPAASAGGAVLAAMESAVRSAGGFAMLLELRLKTAEQRAQMRKLFDRSADYGALVRDVDAAKAAVPRLGPRKAKRQAGEAVTALERRIRESASRGEPRASGKRLRALDAARYRGRVWATRKDPWVDRLASAWLIKRFIDPAARFVWIGAARDRPRKAVGFDFDGAEFTHTGNRVTFEVLLVAFGLDNDPAVAAIGAAVHFLDVGGIPIGDARGLETLLRGIKEKARDDDALLAEAMRVLDHFYSAYAQSRAA
jgi:hypothetical protein